MKAISLTKLFVFGCLLAITGAATIHAAPGDLDLTFAGFGTGGTVITTDASMGAGDKRGIALQPDGKIVTAGYRDRAVIGGMVRELLVMRYLSNGKPDTTFGGGTGKVAYGSGVAAIDVAIQADGRIVVAAQRNPGGGDFLVARLTATGALDTSFDGDGWVTTDFDGGYDTAIAVLIQPDGKIVAGGTASIGGDGDFAVARYNADGSLDTTFGGDGKSSVGMGSTRGGDELADIALQEDGKLVLAGSRFCCTFFPDEDFAITRLNADGTLDESFGTGGKTVASFGGDEFASAVAIGLDGKIVVAGNTGTGVGGDAHVARLYPNGTLDNSFDGDGKLSIGSVSGKIGDVAVQPDGKIVLLGYHTSPDGDIKFALYRRNLNGSADTTLLGGAGFPDFGGNDRGHALALQADGRIIAYGATDNNHVLIRLWADGSFDDGGKQTLGFTNAGFLPGADEQAFATAVQPDGKIIVAGSIANQEFTEGDIALARFLPDGQPDLSFGVYGRVSFGVLNLDRAMAMVLQPDGKIVVAGQAVTDSSGNYNCLIARFNTNGTPDATFGFGGFNLLDFLGGNDYITALALAPDGKLVVAGTVYNGARYVFGVARFNTDGTVDNSFDFDGKQLFEFSLGATHSVGAVVVQRDQKIVVAGHVDGDFALLRLREDGSVDYGWGPDGQGYTVFDMGGFDFIRALAITPRGWFYAAGGRSLNGNEDFALAQIMPNGALASCSGFTCSSWPAGKLFVDWGGNEAALAVDVRSDGQIVAAGIADGKFAWAQVPPNTRFGTIPPLKSTVEFAGNDAAAFAVQFLAPNKLIVAGTQTFNNDSNFALARFETTPIIPTFEDVPSSYWAWQYIESIYGFGITKGCQSEPLRYCPESSVTREQMAAFIIRALHPPGYTPPEPAQQRFLDVPPSSLFYAYIDEMASRQITFGCGAGNYCPTDAVTREQMAAFIIRALHPPGYMPPQPAQQRFLDVPPSNPFYGYIEEMAVRGITTGCGAHNYCPTNPVTRDQMAVFLARAFYLPLP